MRFIITVDTEGQNQWLEEHRRHITTENAQYLPRFQQLCENYGYKPTYLTSYEMVRDGRFVKFARSCLKRGTCEVGAHLHPWSSPPSFALTCDDIKYMPFAVEYPREVIYEKLKFLTELLESTFETRMVSHRAGRWGFDKTYACILEQLNYNVDCSVAPFMSWKETRANRGQYGQVDFTTCPTEPYFLDMEDISRPGKSNILEIPLTVRPHYGAVLMKLHGISSRTLRYLMRKVWGLPFTWCRGYRRYMQQVLEMLEQEIASTCQYIEFMIHSSELMPGGSPTFRTEEEMEALYDHLDKIFRFLHVNGAIGSTCYQFYQLYEKRIDSYQLSYPDRTDRPYPGGPAKAGGALKKLPAARP